MKKKFYPSLLAVILSLVLAASASAACSKIILAYYPYWGQWNTPVYTSAQIPYSKLNIIAHAFLAVDSKGGVSAPAGYLEPALLANAHAAGVSVIASIGGASGTQDANFRTVAGSAALRTTFATNIYNFLSANLYDGVDIDWEFPNSASDKTNLNSMMQAIRNEFNTKSYAGLITMATPPTDWNGQYQDYATLSTYVDYFNVMSYDFAGPWSPNSGHNSPLYQSAADPQQVGSLSVAMDYYLTTRAVPPAKVNAGVPFYGYEFSTVSAPWVSCACSASNVYTLAYYGIVTTTASGWTRTYDAPAGVWYLTKNSPPGFITYNDPQSVGINTNYALVTRTAQGAFMWDLSNDYDGAGNQPLLDAMFSAKQAACGPTPTMTATNTATISATATATRTATRTVTASTTPTQTGTASPSGTATATASVSASATLTPTRTQTASATGTATAMPSATASATVSPSVTPSPSLTPSLSQTASRTITASQTWSATGTTTASPTLSPTGTSTATLTLTRTATDSVTSTGTASASATQTQTGTATKTPSSTATVTDTATQTRTFSVTGTASVTATVTDTPALSFTMTATASVTLSSSQTVTSSQTLTASMTLSASQTMTPSATATRTGTATLTATASATASTTVTASATASNTDSATASATPTWTATASETGTASQTGTATVTATSSETGTASATASQSATASVTVTGSQTATRTATASQTVTGTVTSTRTPSVTSSETATASATPSATSTRTPTATLTDSLTMTASVTATASQTGTASATPPLTPTFTLTSSATATLTPSFTLTPTPVIGKLDIINNMSYPNPVKTGASLTLYYELTTSDADTVKIRIYTVSIRMIRELDDCPAAFGPNSVAWDMRDDTGTPVANGLYYYQVEATRRTNGVRKIGKIAVLR